MGLGKRRASFYQFIHIGCYDLLVAQCPNGTVMLIIGNNDNNIWLRGNGLLCLNRFKRNENGEKDKYCNDQFFCHDYSVI